MEGHCCATTGLDVWWGQLPHGALAGYGKLPHQGDVCRAFCCRGSHRPGHEAVVAVVLRSELRDQRLWMPTIQLGVTGTQSACPRHPRGQLGPAASVANMLAPHHSTWCSSPGGLPVGFLCGTAGSKQDMCHLLRSNVLSSCSRARGWHALQAPG